MWTWCLRYGASKLISIFLVFHPFQNNFNIKQTVSVLWGFHWCFPQQADQKVPLHELFAHMPVNEWHEAELHHVVAYLRNGKHVKIPPEFLPLIPPDGIFWKDHFNFRTSISHWTCSGRVEDPAASLRRSVSSLGVGSNQMVDQFEHQLGFIVGWWVTIAKSVWFSCLHIRSNQWNGKFRALREIHGNKEKISQKHERNFGRNFADNGGNRRTKAEISGMHFVA